MKLTEKSITKLLADRHQKDVFISQCKTGASWGDQRVRILDAWAMPRSYSPLNTIGYEIKCSRSDFLKDHKYTEYLDFCHSFYFVSPWGLIAPDELEPGIGLLWVTKNGRRLRQKKKAFRSDAIKQDVLVYALMSRSKIIKSSFSSSGQEEEPIEYWTRWLQACKEKNKLGRDVSYALSAETHEVTIENAKLKRENQRLVKIKEIAEKLGISLWGATDRQVVKKLYENMFGKLPSEFGDLKYDLDRIKRIADKLLTSIFSG